MVLRSNYKISRFVQLALLRCPIQRIYSSLVNRCQHLYYPNRVFAEDDVNQPGVENFEDFLLLLLVFYFRFENGTRENK